MAASVREPAGWPGARRREVTRSQLVAAARDLFRRTGSPVMSVEQIVRAAGFTRGAFYSNFTSIDDVLFAVYEQDADAMARTVAGRLRALLERAEPITLETISDTLLAITADEATWFSLRAVVLARAQRDAGLRHDLRAHALDLVEQLEPVLLDAVAAAGRAPATEPAVLARGALAAYLGTMVLTAVFDEAVALRRTTVTAVLTGLTEPAS